MDQLHEVSKNKYGSGEGVHATLVKAACTRPPVDPRGSMGMPTQL
jgi:hypothetical protein